MVKKLFIGLAAVIVIIGVGVVLLSANLDSIVRTVVEKVGSEATQTTVKLDSVKISLSSGEAALSGLSIGSPDGFKADKSLYLGSVSVKLDTGSLSGKGPIVIKEVLIEKPQVTYEINNSGDSNFQALARNAQAYASSFSKGAKTENASKEASPESGRKVVIDNLIMQNGQISISQAALEGKTLSANLPVIHLSNIGKSEGGATTADVTEKILSTITTSAAQVASSSLANELGATLKKAGEGALDDTAKDVGSQIKGLFGK